MASRAEANTTHPSPSDSQVRGPISQWFATAEQTIARGQPLGAHEIARLLRLLAPGLFKAVTRMRYYCSYGKLGTEGDTLSGPFDTLEAARAQAHMLVQHGCEGRIEKRHEQTATSIRLHQCGF